MRRRLQEARGEGDVWEVKSGRGRLLDMDLYLQAGALVTGLRGVASPGDMIEALVGNGFLAASEAETMAAANEMFSTIQHLARVAIEGPLRREDMGEGFAALLLEAIGAPDLDAAEAGIVARAAEIAALIDAGVAE